MSLWQIFTSENRISTRLILDIQHFLIKIIFYFEFECHSGRFLHLNIEYPPDRYWIFKISFKKSFFSLNLNVTLADFTSEYRISTRLILNIQNFFSKIIFGFEFECHSGRFSHLNIEYPPD